MLLEYLGEKDAGRIVDQAISDTLAAGRIPDLSVRSGLKTDQIGDMIAQAVADA